ncbi:MAG: YfhO family protein [Anaerolineaceae bacterium]|nr:YfhO family protein [Anaerolineaceae bacterium]
MLNRSVSRNNLALVVLAIALLVIFHRLLLGEVFFWGLPSLQFYPWREYAFDSIRSGHLPFWNPYNGAGAPLLANYQSALLYPLNWFGLFLPLAWSMSVTVVLHLFIAGWGMWMFTGELKLPELGRGISTLSFALTGYLVSRLGTYPTIFAATWIPWLLWATLKVFTDTRRRDIGWLAVFTALQLLAGHAQTTWYSMVLLGVFSAWWAVTHRVRWQRLGIVILALILGAGIATAQLLPTAELLAQSQRSGGVDYDTVMNFSYGWLRIPNFLSPNFFGTPANGTYATEGAFFEDAVYLGLIPLISALVAVLTWAWGKLRRSERPDYFASVPFWLVIVAVAFVLALGKNSPVFPFLYRYIPTFSMFQAPVRWHILTVFGLSVLAGIGVGMWTRGHWVLFGTRLAIAGSIGAAILAGIAPRFLSADLMKIPGVSALVYAVIGLGILGALAGLLTLAQPEERTNRWYNWWVLAVWVVVAGDLVYASWGLNPTVPASFYDRQPVETQTTRGYWPAKIEKNLKFEEGGYLVFDDYRVAVDKQADYRASELPNMNLIDRIPLLNNFEPLLVDPFKQYIDLIERNPNQRASLLNAAGVDYTYDAQGKKIALDETTARAWFVDTVCWYGNDLSVKSAMLRDWNPEHVVNLVKYLGEGICPQSEIEGNVVQSVEDNSDSLTVKVTTNHTAWLVLADTYYPGWSATIDGAATEIRQANLAFRAVQLPAGAHEVKFEYHFRWMWAGILVSIASLMIVMVLFRSRETT